MIMNKNIKKHIIFVLPGRDNSPVGGYKVIYEYANRLIEKYTVSILYPHNKFSFDRIKTSLLKKVYHLCGFYIKKSLHFFQAGEWFNLNPQVKKIFCYKINKNIKRKYKNSLFIATAVETAYDLNNIGITKKNGFYFIQDFEAWNGITEKQVLDSYKFSLNKIAIAPWLVEKVNSVGETAELIPNGFDFDYFKMTTPIENRSPYEIAMLNHTDERKRCEDSIAALKLVKERIPELHVNMFGVPERPNNLPEWFTYYQKPNKKQHNSIYNTAAIFVAASKAEGMALPPAEAMQCGAAICCTDIPGFTLYAKNNTTALLSKVFDIHGLKDNIIKLITDNTLRISIAKNGNVFIQKFTWNKSVKKFTDYIEKATGIVKRGGYKRRVIFHTAPSFRKCA